LTTKNAKQRFDIYTHSEGKTGLGQLVEFTCHPDDVNKVKESLQIIRTVGIPTSGRTSVGHGGYGRYSRFDIAQHKYAGGGNGYIEVLEIKNPPDNRCGLVIHEWNSYDGSIFNEFKSLEEAEAAFDRLWGSQTAERMPTEKGFIRRVVCGGLSPWFYAVGDQHLMGDFVFPDIIGEDPVFRFGRRFIVRDRDGLPTVKTCMGLVLVEKETSSYGHEKKKYRLVHWDDGTTWDEYMAVTQPEPLDAKDLWIQDAIDQFRKLLTGKTDSFTIDFVNGSKFVGKLKLKDAKSTSAEGSYKVSLTMDDGKTKEGEFHFAPTLAIPTVETVFTNRRLRLVGKLPASTP
jgi:hypothetical protein